MNIREKSLYDDISSAAEHLQRRRGKLAKAFLRSLDSAKELTPSLSSEIEQKPAVGDCRTENSAAVSDELNRSRFGQGHDWQEADLAGQNWRDQSLRKTWVIVKVNKNRPVDSNDDMTIVSSTAVTDEFKNQVCGFLRRLPTNLKEVVRKNQTEFLVLRDVAEVDSELAAQPARRRPDLTAVSNIPAFYEPKLNALIFQEKPSLSGCQPVKTGKFERTKQFLEQFGIHFCEVLLPNSLASFAHCSAHAFGRALDKAMAHYSLSAEFEAAFQKDLQGMTEAEKSRLWYFTAPYAAAGEPQDSHNAAKEELFAELFALNTSSGTNKKNAADFLVKKFPAVNKLVQSKIVEPASQQ